MFDIKAYAFRNRRIRPEMLAALMEYVNNGVPLGDFLRAIICHDFYEAIGRADQDNFDNIQAYAGWLYNEPPANCHGSAKAYDAWIEMHQRRRADRGNTEGE